jgi:hypothetical protein
MYVAEARLDLLFFLVGLSVLTAVSALGAAAGAGIKRCVLRCDVSSTRWIGIAGGVLSSAVILGAMWVAHDPESTGLTLAVAVPVIAGFLLVRRAR